MKFHFLAEHAAEDLGRLGIRELAAGDLKLLADKFLWTLEGERYEGPNGVGGDRLIRFTGPDRIHELALENPDLDLVDVIFFLERWFGSHIELQKKFRMTRGCPFGTVGNGVTDKHELIRQNLSHLFEIVKNKPRAFFIREKAQGRTGGRR